MVLVSEKENYTFDDCNSKMYEFRTEDLIVDFFQSGNRDLYFLCIPREDKKENILEMNENPESYANSIISKDVYFEGLGVNILTQSIPNSNLDFVKAKNNKAKVESYLTMIGYKLPSEDFYR